MDNEKLILLLLMMVFVVGCVEKIVYVPSGYQEFEREENSEKKTNVISVVLVIMLVIVIGAGAIIQYVDRKRHK